MLLHIGDTTRWTTADPLLVGLAALALGIGTAVVWSPTVRRRSFRRRVGRMFIVAALLVAVAPSVVPYDHLLPMDVHAGTDETHAAHCHTAPGSCSDAPVSSGAGQFLTTDPLVALPALASLAILLAMPTLAGVTTLPMLRPPLIAR